MRREERFQNILELLDTRGFVTVEELSETFYISLPTVYRDLRELEYQRLIIRGDGGVMRVAEEKANLPLSFRKSIHSREKASIAKRAVALLRPNTTVFIDASTTAGAMVEHITPRMHVTVLTNSLFTAMRLKNAGIRTYCLGGQLIGNSVAVGGRLAEEMADRFEIHMMFFSSYGVDSRGTIIDTSEKESALRRQILRTPATSVFLCDSSKFGKTSIFRVAPMSAVDYAIVDAPLPENCPRPRRGMLVV